MPKFRVYFYVPSMDNENFKQEETAKTPTQARLIVSGQYHPMPIVVTKIKNLTKSKK